MSAAAVSAALLVVTLIGCSPARGPIETTTIVFDGRPHTLNGPVSCTAQPDGRLVILATGDRHAMVRVVLGRDSQLVVEKVGLRIPGGSGFVADPREVWATKVDEVYTISGRMLSDADESTWYQFEVEITCRNEVPLRPSRPSRPFAP